MGISSAEIPPEVTETALEGRSNSRAPFFPLLIHLVILSLLLEVLYQPDKRPIREVNYRVVNLASGC